MTQSWRIAAGPCPFLFAGPLPRTSKARPRRVPYRAGARPARFFSSLPPPPPPPGGGGGCGRTPPNATPGWRRVFPRGAQLEPAIELLTNGFAGYGTRQVFECLTLTFRENADGAFVAHHYRHSPSMSTFVVECDAFTWKKAGLDRMSDAEARAYCERVFAPDLGGHALVSNKSVWRRFSLLSNRRWSSGNCVLIGDALRTVHFSIGSGTRLAVADAIRP